MSARITITRARHGAAYRPHRNWIVWDGTFRWIFEAHEHATAFTRAITNPALRIVGYPIPGLVAVQRGNHRKDQP